MPATQRKSPIRWSTSSQREAAAAFLKMTERAVAVLKRETAGMLSRTELHLRAWRAALDPTTAEWVAQARHTKPDGTPDETRVELQARRDEARRS